MNGNILVGKKIYKMSSKNLLEEAKLTFSGKEFKKIKLNAKLVLKYNEPISLTISNISESSIYPSISFTVTSDIVPEKAILHPITREQIIAQLSRTGNTPYEFSSIDIELGENLYISSIGKLNELRRIALNKLEQKVFASYKKGKKILSFDPIK